MKKETNYAKAMNAVVRIHVKGISDINSRMALDPRAITYDEWVGSGFFIKINNEEGYILTNGHVARNAQHIEIRSVLTSDEPFKVIVVGMVDTLEPDVALLKLSKEELDRFKKICKLKRLPALEFANSENIKRGEEIKAIGFPLGMVEPNVSGGEITNFISGSPENVERFVTDAAINPGNSGGPAILKNSKVVGLNTAIIMDASNIAFITPIHIVKNILPQLILGNEVGIIHLGAYVQKNSSMNALFLKHREVEGLIINRVLKKSLAFNAGIKPNDILLSINGHKLDRHGNIVGQKFSHKKNLFDILHATCYGEKIQFKISRSGKLKSCSAVNQLFQDEGVPYIPILSKRKNIYFEGLVLQEVCGEILEALGEVYGIDGATLYRDYSEAFSQIIVTAVDEESQAFELDFHIGDYVTHVNGKKVKNLKGFITTVNKLVKTESRILLKTSYGAIGYFELSIHSN
jgi:S1-C subfamily serine protease